MTSKQEEIILRKGLTGTVTIRLGIELQADMVLMLEEDPDRYGNFSNFAREWARCFMAIGPDWRNRDSENKKLDRAIELIENLRGVVLTGDPIATGDEANRLIKKFDDSGGFFEE